MPWPTNEPRQFRNATAVVAGLAHFEDVQPGHDRRRVTKLPRLVGRPGHFRSEGQAQGPDGLPVSWKALRLQLSSRRQAGDSRSRLRDPAGAHLVHIHFQSAQVGWPPGTVLTAVLPESSSSGGGYVSGLSLTLSKVFSYKGHRSSYVSAGCPAPKGISRVSFPFARVKLSFVGGRKVGETRPAPAAPAAEPSPRTARPLAARAHSPAPPAPEYISGSRPPTAPRSSPLVARSLWGPRQAKRH